MMHYDDETLFQYAEGNSPIAGEIETHVSDCATCAGEIGSHREMVTALQEREMWEDPPPPPRQFVVDVVQFAQRVKAEDEAAKRLCDQILTGPTNWWAQRLRTVEGACTAGMVKELIERVRPTLDGPQPSNALQITALAISIANELDVVSYPCDYVVKLRAQAYRDHSYVLSYLGRYPEALENAERSRRLFEQVPLPEYDLARLALVRAHTLMAVDRLDEAIQLSRDAADTFLRFGDRTRYISARMYEGAMVYRRGEYREALELWQSVRNEPELDSVMLVRAENNIALCYTALGQPDLAAESLQRCVAEFEMLGMDTARTRSRWSLGQMLVASGRTREAAGVLRQVWREFEAFDMVADAALAALELAEVLLLLGETAEVPSICRDLIARFTRAGMASRAITALSFLREAVAIGQATPSLVRHVHAFLRELPAEQPRLFAPAPAGSPGE